jgi:hypothetical protein
LRHVPRHVGDQTGAATLLDGIAACGIALQCAREHAVQDGRNAKHVEDQVILPVRDAGAAGAPAIRGNVLAFGGNPQRAEVATIKTPELRRGEAPRHDLVGEIRQRVAERGQLPIEHRENAGLGRMEDDVDEAAVAMTDRGFVTGRNIPRQPFDQPSMAGIRSAAAA